MRKICLFFPAVALFCVRIAVAAGPMQAANPAQVDVPVPKGAEHIVITNGDVELRKVFTYFPYPPLPNVSRVTALARTGLFRIEVTPEGTVAAITILRTMGKWLDIPVMKTLVRWKARPGHFRVVDVTWNYTYYPGGIHILH